MKKNIPINKGNYTNMEPPGRADLFNQYRGEGWEEQYWDYRRKWSEWPQKQILSDYPLQLDAELSNICNLDCPMCFRRKEEYNKRHNVRLMDFELFKKIIDQIGCNVPALRLSLRGESTLHPKIVDCIKYAKAKGIKEVSFLTNGSKLAEEFFEELLLAGVDWITISVDGTYEKYEQIRRPLKFEKTLQKVKSTKKVKEKHNAHRPVIKIQSIWSAIRDNPEEFYKTFAPHVDLIAFNPLIDYLGKDEDHLIEYIEHFCCPQPYQRLIVGADGIAMMCTNDEENTEYIGNVNEDSIYEIWHGERLNAIRELHKKRDGFMEIPVCRKCFLPRKTETIETAVVNGREFVIKNYINRNQVIGR